MQEKLLPVKKEAPGVRKSWHRTGQALDIAPGMAVSVYIYAVFEYSGAASSVA
jgi:hypothetical protein